MERQRFSSFVALLQGVYYIITGIWPIFSRRTFEAITGPKFDFWLVRTFGALISVVGGALALAGARRQVTAETALLGIGSAASLAGSDLIYSSRGRISPIYAVESVAEFGLIGLWLISLLVDSRARR